MGIWPDANEGLGSKSIDENQILGEDGFSNPYVDVSTKGGKNALFKVPDAIMDSGGPYEINLPSAGAQYWLLPTGRMFGKMKVVKVVSGEEVNCIDGDDFSLCNLPANSIFRQVELLVNGVNVVDTATTNYHYKSYLETELSYGNDAKSTHLQTAGYYKEYASSCETKKKPSTITEAYTNSGYALRKTLVELSKVWSWGTSLHIDFLECPVPLPAGVNMVLKLHRNDDNFTLITDSSTEFKIKLLALEVEFRRLEYMPAKISRDLELFENGQPYIMPFNKTKMSTRVIPAGRHSFSASDIYRGVLPQQMILGFVKHSAFNGNKKLNPYIFENLNIKSLVFKVNDVNYPATEYKPNWDKDDFAREYIAMHDQLGVRRLNSGIGITLNEFKKNCCFWVLDLSADLCNNAHTHITHTGTIGIEITFHKEPTEAFQTLEYGVFHTALKIDKDRVCELVDKM